MRETRTRRRVSARTQAADRLKAATWLGTGLALALLLALAGNAAGQEQDPGPAAASSPAPAPQTAQEPPEAAAPARKASKPAAAGSAPTAARASKPRSGKGPRTLDEITIEGEIAVPQVLFITARERKHYQDFLHRNYLMSSRELCRDTPVPVRLGSWLLP
jgi:hypothetical protein